MENVGPCPRDVLRYIQNPEAFDSNIKNAVADLGVETLISFFRIIHSTHSNLHKIVLFWRVDCPNPDDVLKDDLYFAVFKSWRIRTLVLDHFSALHLEQASRFFDATRSLPKGSTLVGFALESLANAYISGKNLGNLRGFRDFASMVAVKPLKGYHHRFQHSFPYYEITFMLEATADSCNFVYGSRDKSSDHLLVAPVAPTSPTWLGQARTVHYYNEVASLTPDTRHLYCPVKRNNPLFDSFCLERASDSEIILWVFQMTIAKEHGGEAVSGFPILSTIKEKIRKSLALMESEVVQVRYVLVAPRKAEQVVKWNFPKELGDSSDQVYVQYLDVSLDSYDSLFNPVVPPSA